MTRSCLSHSINRRKGLRFVGVLNLALVAAAGPVHAANDYGNVTNARSHHLSALQSTRVEMLAYAAQHPAPTAALLAAGGAVATFVDNRLDTETRDLIRAAGAFGVIYCLWDQEQARECDLAFEALGEFATRIRFHETELGRISRDVR